MKHGENAQEVNTGAKKPSISIVARRVGDLMEDLGLDTDAGGLADTPMRVAKAYRELLAGYDVDPGEILKRVFNLADDGEIVGLYDGMVLLRDIEFHSLCEHHMLPFVGRAHVAYIPKGDGVVGISKLARVVDAFARRLQVQERLTAQIADCIETHLDPLGVAVVLEAEHFCIRMRGVGKQNSVMTTSDLRGLFSFDAGWQNQFFTLINR